MTIQKRMLKAIDPTSRKSKPAYLVRVEGPRDPLTGKRRQWSRQVDTMKAARSLQKQWEAEIARGTAIAPSAVTVSDLLDDYLRIEAPRTVRPENLVPYESIIRRHLKPIIGSVPVQKLTVQHVDALLAGMQEHGHSSSLITKTRMRLSSALNLAMRWGVVPANVASAAKPPRLEYKTARIWTPAEVSTFLDTAAGVDLWPLWLLMVETGARTSELLGLAWEDVNLDRGTLRIGRQVIRLLKGTPTVKEGGKSAAASRTIRLTPGTVAELRAYRGQWLERKIAATAWASDFLFCTRDGSPLSANNLRRIFDELVQVAGVPAISPHAIRKTAITLALANGASPKAVAARVGHSDVTTTLQTYSSITASMDDDLLDIVAALVPKRAMIGGA